MEKTTNPNLLKAEKEQIIKQLSHKPWWSSIAYDSTTNTIVVSTLKEGRKEALQTLGSLGLQIPTRVRVVGSVKAQPKPTTDKVKGMENLERLKAAARARGAKK